MEYLKAVFSFKGRLNRKPFLVFYIKMFMILFVWLVLSLFEDSNIMRITATLFGWFVVLPSGVLGLTSIPVKRLHDLNLSGRWFLTMVGIVTLLDITLRVIEKYFLVTRDTVSLLENTAFILAIPILICFIVLCFKKGVKGINRYGHDPLSIKL